MCEQSSATLAHSSHCQQEARLDRPIAAHVNICPRQLKEGKEGASSLVSTAFKFFCCWCLVFTFLLAGWEHQARADACSRLLRPAVRVFQKQSRRAKNWKGCSWASSSTQQVSRWKKSSHLLCPERTVYSSFFPKVFPLPGWLQYSEEGCEG